VAVQEQTQELLRFAPHHAMTRITSQAPALKRAVQHAQFAQLATPVFGFLVVLIAVMVLVCRVRLVPRGSTELAVQEPTRELAHHAVIPRVGTTTVTVLGQSREVACRAQQVAPATSTKLQTALQPTI